MGDHRIADAFRIACLVELRALKPGNVHDHAAGHGMTVAEFEASADVAAPWIGAVGLSVGERILAAVQATSRAVGCNTNLGIILLAAPLAQAAMAISDRRHTLKGRLSRVLSDLDLADAKAAYAAIRLAQPAGLGNAKRYDVAHTPGVTLLQAMQAARS